MLVARFTQKLRRFRELDGRDKWMLLRAAIWLAMARILLIVLPLQRLTENLSGKEDAAGRLPDIELLDRIGFALTAAANIVPWRSDCFPKSIAGWMLLKRHGYSSTIHLGVERNGEDELVSHAWLTCGETVVTGGQDLGRYVEIHRLGA